MPRPRPPIEPADGVGRRLAASLHRRPRVRLGALLAARSAGSASPTSARSSILFLNAFWTRDAFTGLVIREFTLENFGEILDDPIYRTVTLRTVGMAAAVTVTCAVLAFPIAYYMARVASPRHAALLVVAVLMPLWASYLIKAYSWRLILVRARRPQLAARAVRPPAARASARSACGWSSPTSGCRT